jgi:hypothetical protein
VAASSGVSRGDLVYDLVQTVADLAADAEGQPRRRVPRLENDTGLPQQLAVVAYDLLAAGGDAALAADAVTKTARALA